MHRLAPIALALLTACSAPSPEPETPAPPHIVLVMADDMGYGQTGYYNHPVLETPNLDAMAQSGLRFDRFYAGAPNCSPTRATVMTGRTNDRTGVFNHGFALRDQERTVAQALRDAGYQTGHFGKWHLNGIRGPGVPILADDTHGPGGFGFDTWLSVTNFFDRNPLMSRQGEFEEFSGDSSEIVVDEALKFLTERAPNGPTFTVIWYGTPHDPMVAADEDMVDFTDLDERSRHQHGELVAMDRSIGTLRQGLRDLGIADNTLFWFCSDNGGLPGIEPSTVGDLRGFKNDIYEGGLRVPAIIEWPSKMPAGRITKHPAVTMDIFPTLAEVVGLDSSVLQQPSDGISLVPLMEADIERREKPIPFRHQNRAALVDNEYKILTLDLESDDYELYNLETDPSETTNLFATEAETAQRMQAAFEAFLASAQESVDGKDYPEGSVDPNQPERHFWMDNAKYEPYFEDWKKRPEYAPRFK